MEQLEVLLADEHYDQYLPQLQKAFNGRANFKGVTNGGMAVQEAEVKHYDVIVLDYNMPGNVFQAAVKISSRHHSVDDKVKVNIVGYHWKQEDADMLKLPLVTDSITEVAKYLAEIAGKNEPA